MAKARRIERVEGGSVWLDPNNPGRPYFGDDNRKQRGFQTQDEARAWVAQRVAKFGVAPEKQPVTGGIPFRGSLEFRI